VISALGGDLSGTSFAKAPPAVQDCLKILAIENLPQLTPSLTAFGAAVATEDAKTFRDVLLANSDALTALMAVSSGIGMELVSAKVPLGLSTSSPDIPAAQMPGNLRLATMMNYHALTTLAGCLGLSSRIVTTRIVENLRKLKLALSDASTPLRERAEHLRYLTYLIAILFFISANLRPPAPLSAPSDKADGLSSAGAEELAVPHDTPPPDHGTDWPAGHGNPIIGRPADT
jgi:hypothetical protein